MDAFSDSSELSDAPTPGPPLTPGHLSPVAAPSPEPAAAKTTTPGSSKQAKYGKRGGAGARARQPAAGARRSSRGGQPSGSSPAADETAASPPPPAPIPSRQKSRDPKRTRLIETSQKPELPDAGECFRRREARCRRRRSCGLSTAAVPDEQDEGGSSRRPSSARARKTAKREPETITPAARSERRASRRAKDEAEPKAAMPTSGDGDELGADDKAAESSQRKIKIKLKRTAQPQHEPEAAKAEASDVERASPPNFRSDSEDEYEESDNEVVVPTKSRRQRKAPLNDFIDDGESEDDEAGPSSASRARKEKGPRAGRKAPPPNKRKADGERPEPAAAAGKKAKPAASASGPLQLPRKAGELRAGETHAEPARPRSSLPGPLGGAGASSSAASGSPAAPAPVRKPAPRPSGMNDFSSIFGGSPAPKPAPPKPAAPPSASKPSVRPPDAPPRPVGPKPLGLATTKKPMRPATPSVGRSAQQAPASYGANGEHVTAEEMAAQRIQEQRRNADTSVSPNARAGAGSCADACVLALRCRICSIYSRPARL